MYSYLLVLMPLRYEQYPSNYIPLLSKTAASMGPAVNLELNEILMDC